MAPPSGRSPGYSRRAQYGLFLGYVIAVSGAVVAMLLLILSAVDPQGFGALRSAVTDATAPASSGSRSVVRSVGGVGDAIGSYFNAASRNRKLEAEAKANRTRMIEARSIAYENVRLKKLLRIVENRPQTIAAARLVSSSASSSRRFAILNAGRNSGVRPGLPVRSAQGLVGRVALAGRWSARVTLISDGGIVIPVRRTRDGLAAISTGTGDGSVDIRALLAEANPFKVGDILVTSGIGGIYAPGIPVAIVTAVGGDTTLARPLADPAGLDFAIVESLYQPQVERQQAVQPPR